MWWTSSHLHTSKRRSILRCHYKQRRRWELGWVVELPVGPLHQQRWLWQEQPVEGDCPGRHHELERPLSSQGLLLFALHLIRRLSMMLV